MRVLFSLHSAQLVITLYNGRAYAYGHQIAYVVVLEQISGNQCIFLHFIILCNAIRPTLYNG